MPFSEQMDQVKRAGKRRAAAFAGQKRATEEMMAGVVLLSFYLDQFRAEVTALSQFGVLLLVMAYRRWYLKEGVVDMG